MEKSRAVPKAARLPLLVYRLLFPVAFLLMLPGFASRMLRRGNYRHKFGQRFAIYSLRVRQRFAGGDWLWIHAVSVGEMMMALKLADMLRENSPDLRILLSTTTSTGFALGRERKREGMELIYYPLDLGPIVRRALNVIRPRQLVLVDKDLWPNMVSECYRRGIPVSIVNARVSPRSERRFLKWKRWVGPIFGMLEQVCVQEPEDLERWHSLGVRREALHCTGSLKFDFAASASSRAGEFRQLLRSIGVTDETPILLGGSTFAGEEALLGRALLQLRKTVPNAFLVIVPRHVERTPEVETALKEIGLSYVLRKGLENASSVEKPDVLVVNTTGELRDWYAVATVCFIGKSICSTGGQNPAEPVLAGKPVIFGPHMENFAALVRQFLACGGAVQVSGEAEIVAEAARLFGDSAAREKLVYAACGVLKAHEGANLRTAALLRALQ